MGGVGWYDGEWGWVALDGRTENGDGWRWMVGRRMGMGSVG